MNGSPIFHIGYHKTATTFLQRALFETSPRFHRVVQRDIFWRLIYPHALEFDVESARQFVADNVAMATANDSLAVFSNERLSGGHHTGGHDSLELAQRIRACSPNARILLFVREQKSLLQSLYAQYVKGMGCASLAEYCNPSYTRHTKELFNPVTLEFDRLVSEYMKRFDQVLVLPVEWLKENPDEVLCRILDFFGLPESRRAGLTLKSRRPRNVSRPATVRRIDRILHPLRSRNIPHVGSTYYNPVGRAFAGLTSRAVSLLPLQPLDRYFHGKERAYIEEFIGDRYSDSNRRLSKLIGMDLSTFGYS